MRVICVSELNKSFEVFNRRTANEKIVLFVCKENACRSQMAEVIFNRLAIKYGTEMRAISAGTKPIDVVNQKAIETMKEIGINISIQKPKLLTQETINKMSIIITMGCMDGCPVTTKEKTIYWDIDDPVGKPIEMFRKVRDELIYRIKKLLIEQGMKTGH
ncbi:MAG: arsenate reductase ArsC [Candidatus Thermoplasmatota archaeon]|nr:arsenate reductase ArsC [Candidatus Thermoplasmatota archaeon]